MIGSPAPTGLPDLPQEPSANGRRANGQFAAGHKFAKGGNPFAKRTSELKAALLECVSPEDVRAIIGELVRRAKEGNILAAREVLDRVLGKPGQAMDIDARLEAEPLAPHERRAALAAILAEGLALGIVQHPAH